MREIHQDGFFCRVCHKWYPRHPVFPDGKMVNDEDYNPFEGRCYDCYLDFLFTLYGGWLEPVIHVNWMVDGQPVDARGMPL